MGPFVVRRPRMSETIFGAEFAAMGEEDELGVRSLPEMRAMRTWRGAEFRFTRPATGVAGVSPTQKISSRPASALFSERRSNVRHGVSRKTTPISPTFLNGRLRMIGRAAVLPTVPGWLLARLPASPRRCTRSGSP